MFRAFYDQVRNRDSPGAARPSDSTERVDSALRSFVEVSPRFQFFLNGNLFPPATKFVSGEGYVRLELPPTDGLEISETQFAPDTDVRFAPNGLPVVLVGVHLRNLRPGVASSELAIAAESELISAFPWSGPSTNPTSESIHQQDEVTADSTMGALQFTQPGQSSWYALVSAALALLRGFGASRDFFMA